MGGSDGRTSDGTYVLPGLLSTPGAHGAVGEIPTGQTLGLGRPLSGPIGGSFETPRVETPRRPLRPLGCQPLRRRPQPSPCVDTDRGPQRQGRRWDSRDRRRVPSSRSTSGLGSRGSCRRPSRGVPGATPGPGPSSATECGVTETPHWGTSKPVGVRTRLEVSTESGEGWVALSSRQPPRGGAGTVVGSLRCERLLPPRYVISKTQ